MRRFFFFASSILVAACSSSPASAPPVNRVTTTAAQAWPNRAEEPPPLTAMEAAQGATIWFACVDPGALESAPSPSTQFGIWVDLMDSHEERAIPAIQGARWEWWARAAIAAHGDCAAVQALQTPMPSGIYCEEDGCWWTGSGVPTATCSGDVVTLGSGTAAVVRDCSQAVAHCEASSPTGCTDRAPVACDASLADRCDGDVKLGCDHSGKTSFHDCTLVGAKCVETATGAKCQRPTPDVCDDQKDTKCSDGRTLHACVRGAFVDVDCTALGLSSCNAAHCVK